MDNLNQTMQTEEPLGVSEDVTKGKKIKLKRSSYPTQNRINFAVIGVEEMKMQVVVPAIILIVLVAGVFGKFFVADRFIKAYRLQSEVAALESRISADEEEIASYGELEKEYAHYTYSGMTADELRLQNREDIVILINKYVLNRANVGSWSVSDNIVSLPITGVTFTQIGEIVADLENDAMVEYCEVVAAATDDSGVVYNTTEGETVVFQGNQEATAQVTVYLADVSPDGTEDTSAQTETEVAQ